MDIALTMRSMLDTAGAVREHGCDGTRQRPFCAGGGYVAMRKSSSLKARDGSPAQGMSQMRRGGGRLREPNAARRLE